MKAKKALVLILTFAFVVFGTAIVSQAANTADQTVTFEVTAINEITVTGEVSLTVNATTAGGAPDSVTDTNSTYSFTTNEAGKKITAGISTAMPTGLTLEVNLTAPDGATSPGYTDISSTGTQDVVTGISQQTGSGLGLTYRLTASPSAGVVASDTRTVTFTLMDSE